jgi:hypothetical protein
VTERSVTFAKFANPSYQADPFVLSSEMEPFPLPRRCSPERPGAVKSAPLLGAAKRTLDGEDRSATMAEEGKAPCGSAQNGPPKWPLRPPPLTVQEAPHRSVRLFTRRVRAHQRPSQAPARGIASRQVGDGTDDRDLLPRASSSPDVRPALRVASPDGYVHQHFLDPVPERLLLLDGAAKLELVLLAGADERINLLPGSAACRCRSGSVRRRTEPDTSRGLHPVL